MTDIPAAVTHLKQISLYLSLNIKKLRAGGTHLYIRPLLDFLHRSASCSLGHITPENGTYFTPLILKVKETPPCSFVLKIQCHFTFILQSLASSQSSALLYML